MSNKAAQSPWQISEPLRLEADDAHKTKLRLACALVALPIVIYVGFFALVALYYLAYLIADFPAFQSDSNVLSNIGYVIFFILGAYIVLMLSRPFFSLSEKIRGVELQAAQEPHAYQLVRQIAHELHMEEDIKVFVSMEISIDGYYRTIADFKAKTMTLNLGLPLVHTLTLEQMAAQVARALSLYADSSQKQSLALIRGFMSWQHRVVNNADGWEDKITAIGERDSLRWLKPVLAPLGVGISVINTVFNAFISFAETASRASVHECQYRADFVEAQTLGSENFEPTLKRLVQVDQAYHSALELVLTQASAPQNINKLIEVQAENAPQSSDHLIEMVPAEHFNGSYLLPDPRSRAKRIKAREIEKKSRMKGPATALIKSLNAVGVSLSNEIYQRYQLGDKRSAIDEAGVKKAPRFTLVDEENILRRFSSGLFRADIVWQPPQDEKIHNLPQEKIKPFLNKVVASIRQNLPVFTRYVEALDEHRKVSEAYHFYKWLVKDGSKNRPETAKIDAAKRALQDFDKKFENTRENLTKSYGVRIAAAVAFGKAHKAYPSAKKLLLMLTRLAHLQALVLDAKLKASTMEKLMARAKVGDSFHQATISRLGKMLMKVIANMETTLLPFPASLLGENNPQDIISGQLDLDQLNGADYEKQVLDRFAELHAFFEAYNIAISAKLAKFVQTMEAKHGVDAVVKVQLQNSKSA